MRKSISVLDKQVSCFFDYRSRKPCATVALVEWLTTKEYRTEILNLRKETDKEKRNEIKANLPAVTISGIFEPTRAAINLEQHTGLIGIDIDQQDNPHIPCIAKMKGEIAKIPNIAYCALSASGNGLFAIVPIECPDKHRHYFDALQIYFHATFGIVIDKACKDVCRLRGISYDPNSYTNHSAAIFKNLPATENRRTNRPVKASTDNTIVNKILTAVLSKKTDLTVDAKDWYLICWVLVYTMGEDGRDMFRAFSQYHSEYNSQKCDKVYDYYMHRKYPFNVGTLINIAKKHNIIY